MGVLPVVVEMQEVGLGLDYKYIENLHKSYNEKLDKAKQKIEQYTIAPNIYSLFSIITISLSIILKWCRRGDLNPHSSRHMHLKHACLPFHHIDMVFYLLIIT